jgi:hypothetical protein
MSSAKGALLHRSGQTTTEPDEWGSSGVDDPVWGSSANNSGNLLDEWLNAGFSGEQMSMTSCHGFCGVPISGTGVPQQWVAVFRQRVGTH